MSQSENIRCSPLLALAPPPPSSPRLRSAGAVPAPSTVALRASDGGRGPDDLGSSTAFAVIPPSPEPSPLSHTRKYRTSRIRPHRPLRLHQRFILPPAAPAASSAAPGPSAHAPPEPCIFRATLLSPPPRVVFARCTRPLYSPRLRAPAARPRPCTPRPHVRQVTLESALIDPKTLIRVINDRAATARDRPPLRPRPLQPCFLSSASPPRSPSHHPRCPRTAPRPLTRLLPLPYIRLTEPDSPPFDSPPSYYLSRRPPRLSDSPRPMPMTPARRIHRALPTHRGSTFSCPSQPIHTRICRT